MLHHLDFDKASLKDLQKAARDECDKRGDSKTWIASAKKADLQGYLEGGDAGQLVAPATTPVDDSDKGGDLASMIADVVAPLVKAESVDMDAVRKLVADEVKAATLPRPVEIAVPDKQAVTFDRAHVILPDVITALSCELHVWLTGPAGSGKTTIVGQAAKALELDFRALSVSAQTPVSALMGYMDANGRYVATAFRHVYEHGGVFCLDEADNGNANVLAVLNAALANGVCSFPDGNVKRHENFRLVACANTFGQGANAHYVGRQKLDAATLDRFVFLQCDYDKSLEAAIGGNADWTKRVQAFRAVVDELGIKTVISPRASVYGAKLLAAGWKQDKVEQALIYKGLPADTVKKLKSRINA